MGDSIINLLNFDTHSTTDEFLNILNSYLFNPHILQPTRITHHSATLTDNIFFNSIVLHTISGNIIYELTDHLPNFLVINKFSTLPKNFKITKRDYSHYNEQKPPEDIQRVDWESELSANGHGNVSTQFDVFYSKVSNMID